LHAIDSYLTGQSDWLVNYAARHRAGLRVGTAITEGTADFLVNRRMNKSQHMRWSRRGADLLLQVRCAVYNGTLGSGFGQRFQPANGYSHVTPNFAAVPKPWRHVDELNAFFVWGAGSPQGHPHLRKRRSNASCTMVALSRSAPLHYR
jgi:hypothetical protein